jgi:hypothetical protein
MSIGKLDGSGILTDLAHLSGLTAAIDVAGSSKIAAANNAKAAIPEFNLVINNFLWPYGAFSELQLLS